MSKFWLAMLIALASVPASATPLITNGSFEITATPVSAGSFINYTLGSTGLTGWTIVGNPGTEVSDVSGTYASGGVSFPAEDGSNWLDLTGDGTNSDTEGVAQTIATNIGDQYTLTFWVGNVDNPGEGWGSTSTVDISANTASLGAFTNSCTTCTTTQMWEEFTVNFTATSASTTLKFLNGDPANDNTNGLDNISLVDDGQAAVTPEPASMMLMGSGLLGLAGLRRRVRS